MITPFDSLYLYYDEKLVSRSAYQVMRHMLKDNLCLCVPRQTALEWRHVHISNTLLNRNYLAVGGQNGASTNFPLYLYPEEGSLDTERRPNLDEKIWAKINDSIKHDTAPEDIFDYIYGVLHSPAYREKYKEFLKVDFPRIPYPKNADEFEHFRSCGNALRELHLMHNVPDSPVRFEQQGSMTVEYLRWEWNKDDGYSGNVWINDTQCFEGVPAEAWDFFIGGYQPAQKWLKDRKGRKLEYDDVEHYRCIIVVLIETARIMKTIDDPSSQVEELKKKVHDLEHQLKAQQTGQIVNYGTININDNRQNIQLK